MRLSLSPKEVSSTGASSTRSQLAVTLVAPQKETRDATLTLLSQCIVRDVVSHNSYPSRLDVVSQWLSDQCDVVLIDLDSHPSNALELVEDICANSHATVMVYSQNPDPLLIVESMRAGAREFLSLPLTLTTLNDAFDRLTLRLPKSGARQKQNRLLTLFGAKGGVGTTTLACNLAIAIAQESGESTLLIDMNLPLGDVALSLGLSSDYSVVDAFQAWERLDASFLSKLLIPHSSGISVLAAPGNGTLTAPTQEAIDKLISIALMEFDNVVIDGGTSLGFTGSSIFSKSSFIYLVCQVGLTELRNSNRLIKQLLRTDGPTVEVVINRYGTKSRGLSDEQITKALTMPAAWKIPNDYAAIQRMAIDAVPVVLGESAVAKQIRKMARAASKQDAPLEKRNTFALFRKVS